MISVIRRSTRRTYEQAMETAQRVPGLEGELAQQRQKTSELEVKNADLEHGIAQLALQQIEDDLNADDVDQEELAAFLRELIEDTDPPGGFMASVAQLLSVAAKRAEQIEPDRDGDASCPLHEAAALITDNAGQLLIWAANSLHPHANDTTT